MTVDAAKVCEIIRSPDRLILPLGCDSILTAQLTAHAAATTEFQRRIPAMAVAARLATLSRGRFAYSEYERTWRWDVVDGKIAAYRDGATPLPTAAPTPLPGTVGAAAVGSPAPAAQPGTTPRVEVFTMEGCSYCQQTKSWMRRQRVAFVERDIGDPRNDMAMQQLPGIDADSGVPIVVIGSTVIEGYDPGAFTQALRS